MEMMMINGNPHKLENLKRYLIRAAPCGEVAGLSQSRRIEGQFNTTRDENCFSRVLLLLEPGVAKYPDELHAVIRTVTGFQYDASHAGTFPVIARMFPGDREPVISERIRDPRASRRLADLLANAAGTDPAGQPQVINSLGRIDPDCLLVIISISRNIEMAEDVRRQLARMNRRAIWVLPAEGIFLNPVRFEQPALTDVAAQDCSLTEEPLTEEPMNTEHIASRIHGYSERGVVNAVFETIAAHPDANRLLEDLLGRTVCWMNASRQVCEEGWVEKFEIYIEPSLSDFGDPDVLLLVKDRYLREWRAFFIEAKMEPFLMSSPPTGEEIDEQPRDDDKDENIPDYRKLASILSGCDFEDGNSEYWRKLWGDLVGHALPERDKYQENTSGLIHELFLKYRFWHPLRHDGNSQTYWTSFAKGIQVYAGETSDCGQNAGRDASDEKRASLRNIGGDPVVLRLVRHLCELAPIAHFVSLTTDPTPTEEERENFDWPLGKAVCRRHQKMCEFNGCGHTAGEWIELSHLLSWFDVRDWANDNHLERVLNALKENEEKFTFWRSCANPSLSIDPQSGDLAHARNNRLLATLEILDPDKDAEWLLIQRTRPWRGTITRNGSPVMRFNPENGLTNGYWVQVVSGLDGDLKARGLPTRFRLPADDDWNIRKDGDGYECLEKLVTGLCKAHAHNTPASRRKP